jgi:hypothetical protein
VATSVFAAPSTDYFEDDSVVTEMVQMHAFSAEQAQALDSSISDLQKQYQQLALQLKGKSSMQITPGVAKTIDTMVDMVTNEIEPAIREAHAADQELLNTKMDAIVDLDKVTASTLALLHGRADDVRSEIKSHNDLAAEWEAAANAHLSAIAEYEKTVKEKTEMCCKKQQAAVPDLEYTPAYAVCDYEESNDKECVAKAVASLQKYISAKFAAGDKEYEGFKADCARLTADVEVDFKDMSVKNSHCDSVSADAKAKEALVNADLPQLQQDWDKEEKAYKSKYDAMSSDYNKEEAHVKNQEVDRKNEWDSTQEIKCMLQAYQAGGKFDDAQMAKCKNQVDHSHLVIVYPPKVPPLVWELGEFDDLTDTSGYYEHCAKEEKAIEDADKNCKIDPQNPIPKCEDHDLDDDAHHEHHEEHEDHEIEPPEDHEKPMKCEGMDVPYTEGKNGVLFTWASPCSGGCSKATPKCGWDICTEEEWEGLPAEQMKIDQPCSSKIFDQKHGHCDKNNKLVRVEDGGYNELVFCYQGHLH